MKKEEGEMEERRRTVEGWIGEDKIKPLRRVHGFLWTEHEVALKNTIGVARCAARAQTLYKQFFVAGKQAGVRLVPICERGRRAARIPPCCWRVEDMQRHSDTIKQERSEHVLESQF